MPLKKSFDLSTGDFTQFSAGETDVTTIGAIATTTPMCSATDNYYSVTYPAAGTPTAYLEDSIADWKSFHGKFKFRLNDATWYNGSRYQTILQLNDGATTNVFNIRLATTADGGAHPNIDYAQVQYRDTSAAQQTLSFDISTQAGAAANLLQDGVAHEFRFQFKVSDPNNANTGIVKLEIDDGAGNFTTIFNETGLDIGSSYACDVLRFGVCAGNVIQDRTIDFGCLYISTNGDYTTDAFTYHVDSVSGLETNDGSLASPFKYTLQANQSAVAGDTIKLLSRGTTSPHRLIDMGQIDVVSAGSANNDITIDGNGQWLTATKDYSDVTWVDSGVNDEWYADVSDIAYDPNRIYVCTRAAWNANGMTALDSDSIRTAGTTGSLNAGEYDYDAGNSRIYYKAAAGETLDATMSTLHIEVPMRLAANDDIMLVDTAYQRVKDITMFGAIGSSVVDSTTSVGSVLDNVTSLESWNHGITLKDATAYHCVGAWTRKTSDPAHSGIHVSGAGSVLGCVAHNNANDGISFNSGTGLAIGNVSYNNGYEAAGDNSGIEATGASNAVTIAHNTCIGNNGSGILWNQGDITAVTISNNICAYNGEKGLVGAADGQNTIAEVTAAFAYNAAYGNGSTGFYFANPTPGAPPLDDVSQSITPSNIVTTDPLFTTVNATAGQVSANSNRTAENYELQSGTPCEDTTDVPATPVVDYYWLTDKVPAPTLQTGCAKSRRGKMGAYR